MRLIDADALKELFSEVIGRIAKKPEMNGNLEHMIRASAMVIQMIDDAPSVQPEQRWSPVTEILPENDDKVLITHSHGISMAWWNGRYWTGSMIRKYKTVTAWMPLPEPYQGGGEDG